MSLRILLLLCAALLVGACAPRPPHDPLEEILATAGNWREGFIEVEDATYIKHRSNIEEVRWSARLSIRNNAPISGYCNVLLQVFDEDGKLLDEYLVFNDILNYESMVTHNDEIFIHRHHLDRISFARYAFNCVKKDMLGR